MSNIALLMILTTVLLSACAKEELASLEDKSSIFYGRNGTRSSAGTYQSVPVPPVEARAPQAETGWVWPAEGKLIGRFGESRGGAAHEGISIAAAEGAPVRASEAGTIAFVSRNSPFYGNLLIVRHAYGVMTSYAHLNTITVKKGDLVRRGEVIATVGMTGKASAPQLHFAVREGQQTIDPLSRLPSRP